MKVCLIFVGNPFTDQRLLNQATALAEDGYEVVALGQVQEGQETYIKQAPFEVELITQHTSLMQKAAGFSRRQIYKSGLLKTNEKHLISRFTEFVAKAKTFRADVYHGVDLPALAIACEAAAGKALVVYDSKEFKTDEFGGLRPAYKQRAIEDLERRCILRADGVITVCDSIASKLSELYGIQKPKVIMNVHPYSAIARESEKKSRKLSVLYQGSTIPNYGLGVEDLIACGKYLDDGIEIVLRLQKASVAYRVELENSIRKLGLEKNILMTDPVPHAQVLQATAKHDIGVLPYLPTCRQFRYALPHRFFDYMMAGLAIIASGTMVDAGNIIKKENLGLTFEPGNPKDLARAINLLANDKELLRTLQNNSLAASRHQYNWTEESKNLLSFYRELANSSGKDTERSK